MLNLSSYTQELLNYASLNEIRLTESDERYLIMSGNQYENSSLLREFNELKIDLKDKNVLDCGCGPGIWAELFLMQGANSVTGIDINDQYLRIAWRLNESSDLGGFSCLNSSLCSLPLKDSSYDFVCSRVVLPYVKNDWVAIDEMIRVLKPGGQIYLLCHGPGFPISQLSRGRFKPIAIFPITIIYRLTNRKIINNTFQFENLIYKYLSSTLKSVRIVKRHKCAGLTSYFSVLATK